MHAILSWRLSDAASHLTQDREKRCFSFPSVHCVCPEPVLVSTWHVEETEGAAPAAQPPSQLTDVTAECEPLPGASAFAAVLSPSSSYISPPLLPRLADSDAAAGSNCDDGAALVSPAPAAAGNNYFSF